VARACDGRRDDRADVHGEGAVGAEVPPGADAAFRGMLGDPVAYRVVCGWSRSLGRGRERAKMDCREREEERAEEAEASGGVAAHKEFLCWKARCCGLFYLRHEGLIW